MSKIQELVGVSPGTRGLTANVIRNSWAQRHERRQSVLLLGEVVELDEWLDWRVKWGQRGAVVFAGFALLFYVLNGIVFRGHNLPLAVAFIVCDIGVIIGLGIYYYKNFSFAIGRSTSADVLHVSMKQSAFF